MYKKIENLLKQRNITPYRLSKDTGIPYTSLHDWKTGRSKPKIDKLIILANYFNVPLNYFVDD